MNPIRVRSTLNTRTYGNIVGYVTLPAPDYPALGANVHAIVVWDGGGITADILSSLQVLKQDYGMTVLACKATTHHELEEAARRAAAASAARGRSRRVGAA